MRSRSLRHLAGLGVATLLGIGLIAGIASNQSTAGLQHLDRVDKNVAALDGLTDTATLQTQISAAFVGLLAEPGVDSAALAARLEEANGLSVTSTAAWGRFTDASLALPGESQMREEFETGLADGLAAGTDLAAVIFGSVTSGDLSPEALHNRLDGIVAMATRARSNGAILDSLIDLYQHELAGSVTAGVASASATAADITRSAVVVSILLAAAWIAAMRSSRRRRRIVDADRAERAVETGRSELESRVQRGVAMATDEASTLHVIDLALRELAFDSTEVLIADSSRAHFHQVIAATGGSSGGCGVSTPNQCPAARTGQAQSFAWSESVDACPYLRDHPTGPCSAICAPINIAGKAVGVMSCTGTRGELPNPHVLANLELLARKTGERLGALRSFSKSEVQARTDSLTGLLNRRSVESEAARVVGEGRRYSVAFGDLDHFKSLNDVFGHDTGDRALRLFSRVLRDSVRPEDIPARYGGEEFVVILPGCSSSDAVLVVERVRERLAEALDGGATPPFTVSFGVASDDSGLPFADLVTMADAALLTAKADGRNCTVVAGAKPAAVPGVDLTPLPA